MGLRENAMMSMRRIQDLESERNALVSEMNILRNQAPSHVPQNTNIDYSQAIRELSNKNDDLRNQLMNQQRINGVARNASMNDQDKQNSLIRRLDELNRRNHELKLQRGGV